jgi:hydroxyacylglutathione hydrolase
MHTLHPIPAFQDNYIWALHNGRSALVVDPGDAAPVRTWLQQQGLALAGMVITHHHADHTGGVRELMAEHPSALAWGPAGEAMPEGVIGVSEGDAVACLGLRWQVIEVPGHTAGHIAFWSAEATGGPLLFCGDTLFSGGCGRLFEGTAGQMLASLDRLAALPDHTRVCCAHEYTLSNLRFARAVEPDNPELWRHSAWCEQARSAGQPTLPSTLALERAINPFLRSREPSVRHALLSRGEAPASDAAAFGQLRLWKDGFR